MGCHRRTHSAPHPVPQGWLCACPADNRIRLMRAEPLARGAKTARDPPLPRPSLTIWLGKETEAGSAATCPLPSSQIQGLVSRPR